MLIDDIIALAAKQDPVFEKQLTGATVLKVHNVAEHVFRTMNTWDIERDFPNIAPPFEQIWMEWTQWADWEPTGPPRPSIPTRYPMGVFLQSYDLHKLRGMDDMEWNKFAGETMPEAARWWTIAHFSRRTLPHTLESAPCFSWCATAEGRMLPIQGGLLTSPHPLHPQKLEDADMEIAEAASMFLPVPFTAISLMHCKNARVVKGPAISPKLARSRQRRGKPPLIRWRTLVIDSSKPVSASLGTGANGGKDKALHIIRGHFKDFSSSSLFGKHRGLYWWAQHARGLAEHGKVEKEYEVRS